MNLFRYREVDKHYTNDQISFLKLKGASIILQNDIVIIIDHKSDELTTCIGRWALYRKWLNEHDIWFRSHHVPGYTILYFDEEEDAIMFRLSNS